MKAWIFEALARLVLSVLVPLIEARSQEAVDELLDKRVRDILPKRLQSTLYREAAEARIRERVGE